MDFKFSKAVILLIFSIFCISRSFLVTVDVDQDCDNPLFNSKLSQFGVLSSCGRSVKARNNIFGNKFNSSNPPDRFSILNILLLLSGNIESNPGPCRKIKFPCGICNKACTKFQPSVACDHCNVWFHKKCIQMNTLNFNSLKNISWYCCNCGLPSFSSELFSDSNSISTSNSFSSLDSSFDFSPNSENFKTSTPLPNSKLKHQSNIISGLSTLIVNFQSFFHKRVEFSNLLNDLKTDVVLASETWLTKDHLNSELCLNDYDIFRNDRSSRGGGVFIAVRKELCGEALPFCKDLESIFVKVNVKGRKSVIFGSVYRPPNSPFDFSLKTVNQIHEIFDKHKNAVFCLGGDFNLPDINWEQEEIVSNQNPFALNSLFLTMAQDLSLNQIINFPTRGTSILDLLFTNRPEIFKSPKLLAGVGDHEIISHNIVLKPFFKKPAKRKILLWSKADESVLLAETKSLKEKLFKLFDCKSNVIEIWEFIKKEIENIIETNVPSKLTTSRQHQPWIDTKTKRLLRRKQKWYQKAKQSNDPNIWKKFKKIKTTTQRTCRQTHNSHLNSIFHNDNSNKKLFSYIKNLRQENVGVPDLKSETGFPIRDPAKKAELIHRQFDSVFSNPSPPIETSFSDTEKFPSMDKIHITSPGIKKILEKLDPHKALGPDNIPGIFLKICAANMADIFSFLFQASLDQGVVPPDWKTANVVPLFKKGDKSQPENYRPISLTSITCKVLEHVVFSSVMSHFDKFSILDDAQHGFRKNRSCVSQLITTLKDFADTLKKKEQTDAILLDFSKAFDKVDHLGLISKLEHYGIRGPLLEWTSSFLIGRKQCVVVDGKASKPTNVLSGVPQGTVLGPLFFLVYINDISKNLTPGTKIRLFADDSLLYRTIKSTKDCEILQKDLNTLQKWEKLWKMEFHPGKCHLLQISNKKSPINFTYKIHNTPLSKVDSAKYLGIIIDSKLNWKKQYSSMILACKQTLSFIRRNLPKASANVKEICYKTLIRPKLEYACPVWDPHHKIHIENIEKVQKAAARFVTGNYKMETGNTLKNLNILGWDSLEERRLKTKLTIFQKGRLGEIDIPTDHLTLKSRPTRRGGGGPTYQKEFSSVDGHLYSFYPSVTRLWNNLPTEVRNCGKLEQFSNNLQKINLTELRQCLQSID